MTHWSDAYMGREWSAETFNCADLAIEVERDVFDRQVNIAGAHVDSPREMHRAISEQLEGAAMETDHPKDGDGVLLRNGSLRHVGVACEIAGEIFVLHNVRHAGVVRHRVRDLDRYGFNIEGFYAWR